MCRILSIVAHCLKRFAPSQLNFEKRLKYLQGKSLYGGAIGDFLLPLTSILSYTVS